MKKETPGTFYAKMAAFARRKKILSRAMFELTYKCNFRCAHCYVSANDKKRELTTKEVFSILDQLKDAGCFDIGFTGGEPLLRKDIFDILEHAKRCGFRISFLTNGQLVNKTTARKLASLGTSLNRVDITVLGATKKTFESITGVRGSFDRVINSIKLLKREGVAVQVKATLMEPNKNEFLKIKNLADKFGCLFRHGPMTSRRADGSRIPLRYQVSPDEVLGIRRLLAGDGKAVERHECIRRKAKPKPAGHKVLFYCGAGQTEVTISPYGEMNFCPEIHYPEYKILDTSLEHCWKKIKNFVEEIKLPKKYKCETCKVASFCRWCPAKAWLLKKDFFSCDPEAKRWALAQAKVSSVNLQK